MAITGVKSIHYRVTGSEQLQRSREFFSEFGLAVQADTSKETTLALPDGARFADHDRPPLMIAGGR